MNKKTIVNFKDVIHIMPYDGIGGVEKAAERIEGQIFGDLRMSRVFIFDRPQEGLEARSTVNPISFIRSAIQVTKQQPALVVLSLWRSVIVGAIARLLGCRSPMVLFLHNSRDSHMVDRWVTALGSMFSNAIWADSKATLQARMKTDKRVRTRVISFIIQRIPVSRDTMPDPSPNFIFWGRLAAQKNILEAVQIFAHVHQSFPGATYDIIGPDHGWKEKIEVKVRQLGIENAVHIHPPTTFARIAELAGNASFYLQTSSHEGMSLSVMESMQLGLVPVVTPVGEIRHYTKDGYNSVWHNLIGKNYQLTAERISDLISDPEKWRNLRENSVHQWIEGPLYAEDFMQASSELLAVLSENSTIRPLS